MSKKVIANLALEDRLEPLTNSVGLFFIIAKAVANVKLVQPIICSVTEIVPQVVSVHTAERITVEDSL